MSKRVIHKIWTYTLLVLCTIIIPACHQTHGQHRDIKVTNPEFKNKLERLLHFSIPLMSVQELHQDMDNVIVLDAREYDEYKISHIPDARHVGYDQFAIQSVKDIDKNAKVVIYCSVGYRSEKVGEQMAKSGFTNVHNLYGSIFEWVNVGYPILNHEGQSTKDVHTYNRAWGKWIEPKTINKIY